MTDCKFGDIVLVPFPFTDQTTNKRRPSVIVSSNTYIERKSQIKVRTHF
jgi:mRNA interferase MazF